MFTKQQEPRSVRTASPFAEAAAGGCPPLPPVQRGRGAGTGLTPRFQGRRALTLPRRGSEAAAGATRGKRPPARVHPSPARLPRAAALPSRRSVHKPRPLTRGSELRRLPVSRRDAPPHPSGKPREAGEARGPERVGGRRARARVLTFPLRPPPPAPLRLASELTARPSGPSAGPQHRCHGRDSGGQDGKPSSPVPPCPLAPPPPPLSASAPANASRLTFEDRALPRSPPSLLLRLSCHWFPAALRACGPRPGPALRSAAGRAPGRAAPRSRRGLCSRGLSCSGLRTQGFYFGTSASCWAPATLKPITQGACLFAAAKSN